MKPSRFLVSLFLAALTWHGVAADLTATDELVGVDKRREHRSPPGAAQRAAHAQLGQKVAGGAVDFDPLLGSPKWVRSREDFLTGPKGEGKGVSAQAAARYKADEHAAIKAFVDENSALFGHGPDVLDAAVKTRDYVTPHNGVRTVVWQQRVDEIPIYESVFSAHVGRAGELIDISSLFVPDPIKAANRGTPNRGQQLRNQKVSAQRAVEIAVPIIGESVTNLASVDSASEGAEQAQRFKVKPLPGGAEAKLVWFPLDRDTLRLCWQVELSRRKFNERFRVLVDVQDGEVLLWRKLTVEIGAVTYRVYTNDSPTPMRPGWPTPNVEQPPLTQSSLVTISALSSNASPLGWINDGETLLRGNNVDAAPDRDFDDRPDLPRATASVNGSGQRTFDFPILPDQNPTNYTQGAAVQLFYWCNWMHDRLYDIGFTEAKGNFQKDNFGRIPLSMPISDRARAGNDPILADAQDGSGVNNANFTPSGDGSSARIQMYIFTGPSPAHDGDLDAEVILHEYTHGMSDRRVGHGVGISQFQTFGMGEGWSDFFAEAMLTGFDHDLDANYPMGGYASYKLSGLQESYYYGIRRYPYTTVTNISPLRFSDIDPLQESTYPGIPRSPIATGNGSAVHRQGEVWCLMLWEVRAALLRRMNLTAQNYQASNDFVMRIIADGMDFAPPNPTFVQARDAILAAERALPGGGGANASVIWSAFAKRGLGLSASSPDVTTTFGVIAAYDVPPANGPLVTPDSVSFDGLAGKTFSPDSQSFKITSRSSEPLSWSVTVNVPWLTLLPTNGTLPPFGEALVVALTNGFSSLPVGQHIALMTFSNSVSPVPIARTVVVNAFASADPLSVSPTSIYNIDGAVGGPFSPSSRTYTIQAADPLFWYATNLPTWLSLSAKSGLLAAGDSFDITASVNGAGTLLPPDIYLTNFSIINSNTGFKVNLPVVLHVGSNAELVEEFSSHPFDLGYSTLTLRPVGDTYSACIAGATNFPTDPAGAITLTGLHDDEYRLVTLTNGSIGLGVVSNFASFFGVATSSFWIGANGNVTPDPGPNTNFFTLGLDEFFARVRIAPLYSDLNPDAGGRVSWQQLSNRAVVTWENVPEFGTANLNNLQTELFFDGTIRMTWLKVEAVYPQPIVGISRGTGYPPGLIQSDLSAVTCSPIAQLLLPSHAREGDAPVTANLSLSVASTTNLTVTLTVDNTNEISVPASIVIPANTVAGSFPVTILDDALLDGAQAATIIASFPDRPAAMATITVEDSETTRVNVRVPAIVQEGAGVLTNVGLVALGDFSVFDFVGTPVDRDVTVKLQASTNSRVALPQSVIVPAGSYLATFDIFVGNDDLLNSNSASNREPVTITASVANWDTDFDLLTVEDNEEYKLTLSLVPQVTENGGNVAAGGVVSLSGTATVDIAVTFTSSAPSTVFAPAAVTIPAGSRSNTFALFVVDNNDTNAFDSVRIVASAPAFISATGSVLVIDDDRPTPPINPLPAVGATHISPATLLSWSLNPLPKLGALQFDVYLSTNANPTNLIGTTTNLSIAVPFQLSSETKYYWKVSARRAPFVETSAIWNFTTAPFDHFTVEAVASPQAVGQPFAVSVTARDEFNLVVKNYAGTVTLDNVAPVKSSSTIAITEVDTGDLDKIEFQNVSDRDINIAGWQIAVYDWTSWPSPKTIFGIPGPSLCRSGEVFQLRTLLPRFAPGIYPNFTFATNIFWNNNGSSNQIAVMLLDTLGNVVDFMCAVDAVPAQITVPATVDANQWRGMPIAANLNSALNYQRIGYNDNNDAGDWSVGAKNIPTNNPALIVPFTNFTSVAMSAPIFDTFVSGVATAPVTIFEEARGLILMADDGLGHQGSGAPFDVLAQDDIAIAISAPATVTVLDPLQCRITVTNSGSSAAIGVVVTNFLPPSATFLSALPTQGACAFSDGAVFCDLGNLPGHTSATVIVAMASSVFGMVTNVATVGRSDADSYAGNNVASAVTLSALPQLTIGDATNSEPTASTPSVLSFPVRLSLPSSATTSVQFATMEINGAIAGVDFVPTNGVVIFPPGTTNQTIVVPILNDTLAESNEVFAVVLSAAVNAQITRISATGTINDNDSNPGLSITDVSVLEIDSGSIALTYSVSLSTNSGKFINVSYQTSDGSAVAYSDYVPTYGNLVFTPGTTNRTITVTVLADTAYEPTETFAVVLSSPGNAFIAKAQGVCTIFDNDTNQLHHFAFETVPPNALVNVPSNFVGSARNPGGGLVPDFAGSLRLIATDGETTRSVGTNSVPWEFPMGAGFHDSRLQVIYLTNDLGATGQMTALSLDITNVPGQVLSNFTIRTKPIAVGQFPSLAWDSAGWTTNYSAQTTVLSTGWFNFAFHTPAICSGSNLLVDFSFNNSSYSSDGMCRSTVVPGMRALGFRTDSAFGDPLSWSNNVPQAVAISRIPNARFTIGKPVRVSPSLVTNVAGGFWSAAVSFLDPASNLSLRAVDDAGHVGIYGGLVVTLDTDGDGLPDWWEIDNGFDRLVADGAAAADSDGDGIDNLHEYQAGTDPYDPASQFRILAITPVTNSVRVTVSTVTGKQYLLESSTNLTSWIPVDNVPKPGTGGPLNLVDPAPGVKRFYRVNVKP